MDKGFARIAISIFPVRIWNNCKNIQATHGNEIFQVYLFWIEK